MIPPPFRAHPLLCAAALAVLLMGGCGFIRGSAPVVDRSQDARILAAVERRILEEPALDAEPLRVEVQGGVVILYGAVRGMAAWRCALRNAELVAGVRSVVDYLTLQRGPRDAPCLAPATTP